MCYTIKHIMYSYILILFQYNIISYSGFPYGFKLRDRSNIVTPGAPDPSLDCLQGRLEELGDGRLPPINAAEA